MIISTEFNYVLAAAMKVLNSSSCKFLFNLNIKKSIELFIFSVRFPDKKITYSAPIIQIDKVLVLEMEK